MNSTSITPLARPAALQRRCAPILAVSGGKGGVGKTTLAANLGIELARAGKRVLLVDADFGLANLDIALGLDVRRNAEHFFTKGAALEDCVVEGPAGTHVLPAGSGCPSMARLSAARRAEFLEELADLSVNYDLVIVDCAAGIGPDVLAICGDADHVLIVTTPDPAAVTDAYGVIKALDSWGLDSGVEIPTPELVINQVAGADEADAVAARVGSVCQRFLARSPVLGGWIPRCEVVRRAARQRRPFAVGEPNSLSALCLGNLARRMERRASARVRTLRG